MEPAALSLFISILMASAESLWGELGLNGLGQSLIVFCTVSIESSVLLTTYVTSNKVMGWLLTLVSGIG
jgi:hypothetical protein